MRRIHQIAWVACALFWAASLPAVADRVIAPFKCELVSGALHVEAGPVRMYRLSGKSTQRALRICSASNEAAKCRTLIVHDFDVECAGGSASWRDIVGRLIATRTKDVGIKDGQLTFKLKEPSFATINPLCGHDGGANFDITAAADHWGLDATCREFGYVPTRRVTMPVGYAPLSEVGGRLIITEVASETTLPPPPERRPDAQAPSVRSRDMLSSPSDQRGVKPPYVSVATTSRPASPRPTSVSRSAPTAAPPFEAAQEPSAQQLVSAIARAGQQPAEQQGAQSVTLNSWSTIVEVIRASTSEGAPHQVRRTMQQSIIATILVVALMTSVLSGIGWVAVRGFQRAPDIRKVDPYQVMLRREVVDLAKPDAQMCGELCRSAQTLVGQIHAGASELQGVAPLRRVLLREVRSMEKFLSANLGHQPSAPDEWRRMRMRLQRVVTDLMRLNDITEGAKRSLSSVTIRKELPRDKHEAFEVLGANPEASEKILKRLVDALRATWHPDHAQSEEDRQAREERIKQINVAWDLIQEKRVEA